MHRVALIVLYDDRQNVLLQHRTVDAHFFPGHWAFFGGSCESDETPLEAVIREAEEELCYRLTAPRLVMEQPFSVNGLECLMYLYVEQHHGRACCDCARDRVGDGLELAKPKNS